MRKITPLFSYLLTKLERDLFPFALVNSSRDYRSAPGPLIPGCVGWFFESVVWQILNSGCWLKTVVDFEFYLSCYTSYPACLQLVILFVILHHEDQDPIHIIWYSELCYHGRISYP
jgi:hypothetical protein